MVSLTPLDETTWGRFAPHTIRLVKPWTEEELAALTAAAQEGDEGAWTKLQAHYQSVVYHFLWRQTASAEVAEDLTQDTFLKGWLAISATKPNLRFGGWIYRIAMNRFLDWRRHERLITWHPIDALQRVLRDAPNSAWQSTAEVRQAAQLKGLLRQRDHAEALLADPDPRHNPEMACLRDEVTHEVRAVLDGIDGRQGEVLTLREYGELNYDEIASRLVTTRAAVKSSLFRARKDFLLRWQAQEQEREESYADYQS